MSTREIYIPPRGIFFRLIGYESQYVIFSRNNKEPQVGHTRADGLIPYQSSDDEFFELIPGTGKREGLYAIKGKASGKVLYSRGNPPPNVYHVEGDGTYDDNWFQLVPGTGMLANYFQLVTPSTGLAIFSRTNQSPYFWNYNKNAEFHDQFFAFLFEDMVIERVEYDLKLGKIMSSTPLMLANQTLVNDSDHEQEMSFAISETVTHTSSFVYTLGITIGASATFKAGVPLVAEAEFTVSVELSNEFTWGREESFSHNYTASFPVKANPHTIVRAVSTVNQGTLEVPYTIILKSKSSGARAESKGIWHGVSTWDLRHTITNLKIGETEAALE